METLDTRGRRTNSNRRVSLIPIDIGDRRSGTDRRSGVDRRSGIDRRSSRGFRVIAGQDRRRKSSNPPLFDFLTPPDSVLRVMQFKNN
jgi:hypothetical protein